jgi:GYF domain 2
MSETWYYAEADRPVGPISLDELKRRLSKMKERRKKLVWNASFSEWREAGTVPELDIVEPPPIPKQAAKPAIDLMRAVKAWAAFCAIAYIVLTAHRLSIDHPTTTELNVSTYVQFLGALAILLGLIALGDWVWRHVGKRS